MAKASVMQQTKPASQPDSTQGQRPPPHRLPAPKLLPKLPTPRLTPRRFTPRRPAKEKAVEQRASSAKRDDMPEPYFKPSEVDLSGAAEELSGPPASQIGSAQSRRSPGLGQPTSIDVVGFDSSSVVAPPVPPLATGLAASLRAALDAALGDQEDALEAVDESDWTPRPQEMPDPAAPARQPQLDLLMHEMLDAQGLPPPVRAGHPTAHFRSLIRCRLYLAVPRASRAAAGACEDTGAVRRQQVRDAQGVPAAASSHAAKAGASGLRWRQ